MYIILRLVCETFSRIDVKISFLRGPKHDIYAATSFSANVTSLCSRKDAQFFYYFRYYEYERHIYCTVTVWW